MIKEVFCLTEKLDAWKYDSYYFMEFLIEASSFL